MKIITNKQYKEYKKLKENVLIQQKFDSVKSLKTVERDIDEPIKLVVAMLALLGANPIFSCCGFDYDGQPLHKTHEYGCAYVIMHKNNANKVLVDWLRNVEFVKDDDGKFYGWTEVSKDENVMLLRSAFTREQERDGYPWVSQRTCIHYSELGVLNIGALAKALYFLKDNFKDEAILEDYNNHYKKTKFYKGWQYPALEPWVIRKEDILQVIK